MMITDVLHSVALQKPRRVTTCSAWTEHTPFAMNLVALLRPRTIVELGTYSGDSFCAFCQAVDFLELDTRCFAIDTWGGDEHSGRYGPEVLAELRAHHDPNYGRFSRLVQSTFADAVSAFPDRSIDLLHIDGFHTYEQVKEDYETWAPKLSDAAVAVFHDTNVREHEFGVWRFWRELREGRPSFEFHHGHGLGVVAVGAAPPSGAMPLFSATPEKQEQIRAIFFALGQRAALARDLDAVTAQWRTASANASGATEEVKRLSARVAELEREASAVREELARVREKHAEERASWWGERTEDRARLEVEKEQLAAEIERERELRQQEAARAEGLARDLQAIVTSRSWQIVQRYRSGRDVARTIAADVRKVRDLRAKGDLRSVGQVLGALRRRLAPKSPSPAGAASPEPAVRERGSLHEVVRARFPAIQPLQVFASPQRGMRLNLVTDSISPNWLFGGVGTAMVLGALLAERRDCTLRIVTRNDAPDPVAFQRVLEANGIEYARNPEFAFVQVGNPRQSLDVGDEDVFLTTSWWTTHSVLGSVPADRVMYLLQEDERMFYPAGDEQLRCAELLRRPGLRFVVNSKLLFDHLVADGHDNIRDAGLWFEPSFPLVAFHPEWDAPRGIKRNFLFYARPNNQRNLFYRGIEAIDAAVARGVLDLDEWDLHFVGKDLPRIHLDGGYRPKLVQTLPWAEYAAFIRSMDLGLCLMYTPHPSYPPLDLAASGAVAVTNRSGLKRDLDCYSPNVLCSDVDVESLVQRIADGVRLATDVAARRRNYEQSGLLRDWRVSFAEVLSALDRI